MILTLISVFVVFGVLTILYIAYSISGRIFTREVSKPSAVPNGADTTAEEEIAAAIAVALYEEEMAALSEVTDGMVHDLESGIITIKR